jgi:trans-2,3-dihydro-3-hydroxyanthranilate isomerase
MGGHRYRVVDVFTRHALEGNPLAVFPDASGLEDHTMQKIARELNLSETTFALKDKNAVDRAWLDLAGLRTLKKEQTEAVCVLVFTPTPEGAYSRTFAPEHGVAEDPATGSAAGPLAAYMMRHKLVSGASGTRFFSEQGAKMGRRGILYADIRGEQGSDGIDVGGYVTPVAEATMSI